MSLPFYNNVYFIVNNNDSKFCSKKFHNKVEL